MPHFYREAERKLAREQRRLSRKQKGSANYEKQRIKVARAFEKVRNCRQDWQHKLSTKLAEQYDIVAVEDIDYKAMSQGLHLAKATNDNGFGQFRTFLFYKLIERGKKLVTIDKWFPSSKTCNQCGYVNSELKLGDRSWICPECGTVHNRDLNAAINIKKQGLLLYAQ
jgi:putative transposase